METKVENNNNSFLIKLATFIVDRRNLIFLLFGIGIIFSVAASGWVNVENDLATYLPDSTETKQGIDLMDEEFVTYGSAKIMVTNIDYDTAKKLSETLDVISRQQASRHNCASQRQGIKYICPPCIYAANGNP